MVIYGQNGSGKTRLSRELVRGLFCLNSFPGTDSEDEMQDIINIDTLVELDNNKKYRFIKSRIALEIYSIEKNPHELLLSINPENRLTDAPEIIGNIQDKDLVSFIDHRRFNIFAETSFIPSSSDHYNDTIPKYSVLEKILLCDKSDFINNYNRIVNIFSPEKNEDNLLLNEINKYKLLLEELDKKFQIIEIKNTRLEKLKKEQNLIKSEIDDFQNIKAEKTAQNKTLLLIRDNINIINRLNTKLEKIRVSLENEKQILEKITDMENGISKQYPQFCKLENADLKKLDSIQQIFDKMRNLNSQIDNISSRRTAAAKKIRQFSSLINISAVLFIILFYFNNGFNLTEYAHLITGVAFSAIAFAVSTFLFIKYRPASKTTAIMNNKKTELGTTLADLVETSSINPARYKLGEIYEFMLQYFEDYVDYIDKTEDLDRLKANLKSQKHMNNIHNRLETLQDQEKDAKDKIQKNLKKLGFEDTFAPDTEFTDEQISINQEELENLEKSLNSKNQILKQIDREIIQNPDSSDEKKQLQKKRTGIEEIINKLSITWNSLHFTIDIMESGIRSRKENQVHKLIKASLKNFNYLTDSIYKEEIHENFVKKFLKEGIIPENMSMSVFHDLILSIKFALTDFLIDAGLSFPLIMDDPFLIMDDDKTERCRNLLLEISEKRQIIIFSLKKLKNYPGLQLELQNKWTTTDN